MQYQSDVRMTCSRLVYHMLVLFSQTLANVLVRISQRQLFYSHDDECRLDAALKHSKQESHRHQPREVDSGSRAANNDTPTDNVGRQVLGDWQFLQQKVGRILANENAHVQDGAEPVEAVPGQVGILNDTHHRGEAQCSLVERLTKVCTQHAGKNSLVDGPEETLTCLFIDVDDFASNIGGNLWKRVNQ